MKLGRFRRRGVTFRVALVLLLSLLFQHAAIAAYACPLDGAVARAEAPMSDCASMDRMDPPALCDKHCNPDDSTPPDLRIVQVPPVLLPLARFDLARTLPHAAASLQHCRSTPVSGADPPPTLRFCSLLI